MTAPHGLSCFVLHTRSYTDTRILVELLTDWHGRVSGVYRLPSRKLQQRPQPFTPYVAEISGNGDLKTIRSLEADGSNTSLQATALYCGIYLNEILLRLLRREEPVEGIVSIYRHSLDELRSRSAHEPILRRFEIQLLDELGYGMDLNSDVTGEVIREDGVYRFENDSGFVPVATASRKADCFNGAEILAVARDELDADLGRRAAKRLCRLALDPLLGTRPLRSRELFTRMPR